MVWKKGEKRSDEPKEKSRDEFIRELIKDLYTGDKKGRKLKPGGKVKLTTLINTQLSNDKNNIVTLGCFQFIPKSLQEKIHGKELYKRMTSKEKREVYEKIVEMESSSKCLVCIKNKDSVDVDSLKFRTIFNTQERQLVIGEPKK